jgi:polyisoprenoid-binding protein YceI
MLVWNCKRWALPAAFLALSIVIGLKAATGKTEKTGAVERRAPVGAAAGATAPNTVTYKIDAGKNRFTVRAFVGGLFSAFGHDHTIAVREFSGEARFTPGSLDASSLHITVKADSLSVIDKVSESDRQEIEGKMRREVLETGKYPEIVFDSTNISAEKIADGKYRVKIEGDLKLHGVTRRAVINAQVTEEGDALRARGEFPLRQTEYHISPPSVAGGTIKVKDELKLSFDIIAHS